MAWGSLFFIFGFVIQIQNVSKSFGMQVLLDGASMLVADHERVGLVGRNGCGKSTLFKMILGQECLDGGNIDIPKGYTIGYLQQHIKFTHSTVHEEACSVDAFVGWFPDPFEFGEGLGVGTGHAFAGRTDELLGHCFHALAQPLFARVEGRSALDYA